MLRTLRETKKSWWADHLNQVVHAYNCTKNETTGFSPFYLQFGRHPRLPIDLIFGIDRTGNQGSHTQYAAQLQKAMSEANELQWGTKVLTHFRKMAPFCIVDILIPFPCLPQPLPPQNQCWILDPQVFFLLQTTLFRGVRGFTAFKKNEIINELNVC